MARGQLRELSILERPFTEGALRIAIDSARSHAPGEIVGSYLDALYVAVEKYAVRPGNSDTVAAQTFRAHLAAIVQSSEDAIMSKDLTGRITSWNPAAMRLFGYTAEEAIGSPISILIPPERLREESNILERLRRGERIEHLETIRLTKDRRPLHVSLTISPIFNAEGEVVEASNNYPRYYPTQTAGTRTGRGS